VILQGQEVRSDVNLAKLARVYLLVLAAVILLASPSFAGKEAISDQDLDRMSAAGTCQAGLSACDASDEDSGAAQPPAIAQDKNGLQVTTTATNILTLNGAQQGIRTFILNNVVGTNQIATGVNVSAGGPR
jgi:hypothetical protein